MGRLILLVLIIVTIVLLWKAFGPGSGQSGAARGVSQLGRKKQQPETRAKGPDDDPDFLWSIEKERFKQRREQERQAEREAEQRARQERLEQRRREQEQLNQERLDQERLDQERLEQDPPNRPDLDNLGQGHPDDRRPDTDS